MRIAVALGIVLASAGCTRHSSDYFPLDAGRNWDYRVTVAIKGQKREQRLLLGSVPSKTVDGAVYYPRRLLDGKMEYHERSADGVLAVEPVSGRKSLVLPPGPRAGTKWQGGTHISSWKSPACSRRPSRSGCSRPSRWSSRWRPTTTR